MEKINVNSFNFGDSRRIETAKSSGATKGALKITNNAGVDNYEKSGAYLINTGIGICISNMPSSAGSGILLRDYIDSSSYLLQIEHKSAVSGKYAINIANYITSASALVIHQYSSKDAAMVIDNVGTGEFIRMRNARNQTYVPDVLGSGNYIKFERYDQALESLGHIDDECDFYFSKTGGLNGVCLLDRTSKG